MAKVICTLPNASDEISGVKFTKHARGVVSEDISDEQAAAFLEIKGYEMEGDIDGDGDSDLADLAARAAELGIAVKSTWKAQRLQAEIKRAEDSKAASVNAGADGAKSE